MSSAELPRYKCIKEVWALKIRQIVGEWIYPEDENYSRIEVSPDYLLKHAPRPGGYYVVYKDGYKSFSPAEVFEEGYIPLFELDFSRRNTPSPD